MTVEVAIADDESAVLIHDLASWLRAEDDLRGQVRLRAAAPVVGTLGSVVEAIVVAVTPATATALTTVLVTWLRQRRGKIRVSLRTEDGTTAELTAEGVTGLSAGEVTALASELAARLR